MSQLRQTIASPHQDFPLCISSILENTSWRGETRQARNLLQTNSLQPWASLCGSHHTTAPPSTTQTPPTLRLPRVTSAFWHKVLFRHRNQTRGIICSDHSYFPFPPFLQRKKKNKHFLSHNGAQAVWVFVRVCVNLPAQPKSTLPPVMFCFSASCSTQGLWKKKTCLDFSRSEMSWQRRLK